ncbi:glycosyltransferase family protein [Mesobacillus foraminis]|uniref:Glycosyl transferase family 1 n=1 Tax=Mesobacillus foraminis TaxID=279826 RepID=A0A4R2BMF3_9BACI|nr:glycosyltransferase [Mesobacillus foraminis]TCN27833.1 glycosyl transferase family 1 [Mesobacillus foraminis]
MFNLLFISNDTSNTLDKNFYFLEKQCSTLTNLSVYRSSGRLSHISKKLEQPPDFILLANDLGKEMFPIIHGISSIDIPVGLFVNDVHRFTKTRRHFIRKNAIQYLFSATRDKFIESYPELKDNLIWFPHFINPHVYKDYGLKKDIDLLMMGAVNDTYPLRKKILEFYQHRPNFLYHSHPGYELENPAARDVFYIGEKYARELNRAKIFFTCPSVYYYPVMKYFEALACRTLLLAPAFKELEDLGFIPGKHFVAIDEYNFMEKALYYLENEKERKKITDAGFEFIHRTHTLPIRTRQLISHIKTIIKNEGVL